MNVDSVIRGIIDTRSALRENDAMFAPVELSENMYRLAQYVSSAEEIVSEIESELVIEEAALTTSLARNNWSTTKVNQHVKLQTAEQRSVLVRLNKLIDSSWKLINVTQSRRNHITEELKNSI